MKGRNAFSAGAELSDKLELVASCEAQRVRTRRRPV